MDRIRGFEKISKDRFLCDVKITEKSEENLYNEIKLPKRATAKSAGYDCYSIYNFELKPNEEFLLPTGIKAYMQNDEVLKAYPRSGLGFKYYIRLANTIGVIDADYINSNNEGHIWVKLRNEGTKILEINKGEAICQFIFEKYLLADGDDYIGEERNGGFGSTS